MSHQRYFSYIRVSTPRQGQHGTSLQEQQAAIEHYARKLNLPIIKQYEERESASTADNRRVFLEMVKALRHGQADGVIVHKIDRSARNIHEWADFSSLSDEGFDVHFAHETIDLKTRGGRLSADIQAVVAADYIRNLRDEVKKGFYGRLKQGLYPMPAPIGYVDKGQGQAKEPHPVYAPLIEKTFELYATGKWSLASLIERMTQLGLRNRTGNPVTRNGMATLLRNPFYTGLIRIEKTGEIFAGVHQPLIAKDLFDRVQAVLDGKTVEKKHTHEFIFRRLIACGGCSYKLIGERQKGYVYYRCHTSTCSQKTIREDEAESQLYPMLEQLRFTARENYYLKRILTRQSNDAERFRQTRRQALQLRLEQCQERLSKLTDALIDGTIERELFINKKNSLTVEAHQITTQLANLAGAEREAFGKTVKILEQANEACLSYKEGNGEEKREMLQILASNLTATGKSLEFKLNYPFELIANRHKVSNGGAHRDVPRTYSASLSQLMKSLYEFFSVNETDYHK